MDHQPTDTLPTPKSLLILMKMLLVRKNKQSLTLVLKPMAHTQYYTNVMDAKTIQDYQQNPQGVQLSK